MSPTPKIKDQGLGMFFKILIFLSTALISIVTAIAVELRQDVKILTAERSGMIEKYVNVRDIVDRHEKTLERIAEKQDKLLFCCQ